MGRNSSRRLLQCIWKTDPVFWCAQTKLCKQAQTKLCAHVVFIASAAEMIVSCKQMKPKVPFQVCGEVKVCAIHTLFVSHTINGSTCRSNLLFRTCASCSPWSPNATKCLTIRGGVRVCFCC